MSVAVFALLLGCTQPDSPLKPVATATLVSVTPHPATPIPTLFATPTPVVVVSSAIPAPVTGPKKPENLEAFARTIEPVFAVVFNKTKKASALSEDHWILDDLSSVYRVELYIRRSKTLNWTSFEIPVRVKNPAGNVTKSAVVNSDSKNALFSTTATFKCWNWDYEINLDLRDYDVYPDGSFKNVLGPLFLSQLVDVCPD